MNLLSPNIDSIYLTSSCFSNNFVSLSLKKVNEVFSSMFLEFFLEWKISFKNSIDIGSALSFPISFSELYSSDIFFSLIKVISLVE